MSGNSNQQLRKTIGFNAALFTVVGILIAKNTPTAILCLFLSLFPI